LIVANGEDLTEITFIVLLLRLKMF
jgi:hypothetical protein